MAKLGPDVQVKTAAVCFKLTPEQHRVLTQRAAQNGVPLGTWMRAILLQAATQKPRKGYLHIREPNGATS